PIVRNVEVTVYDNDQPDVILAQLDPFSATPPSHIDNNTVVVEGWGTETSGDADPAKRHTITELSDVYSVSLANAPASGSVTIDLTLSDVAPDPIRVCLTSSDPLPHAGAVNRFS